MNRSLSLGLLLILISLSAPHGAVADPSPNPMPSVKSSPDNKDDSELGVYMLRDEDLKPSVAACLKDHGLGVCLKQESEKELGPPPSNPEKTDSGLNPAWSDFLKKVIGIPDHVLDKGHLFGSLGGTFAITRLDSDEVVSDPNKLATDQKLGTPGVWARHLIELVPQIGYEEPFGKDDYAAGILSFHGVLRLTLRHPMDQIYNDSFSGFTRSEIKILEQLVPMYLKIPHQLVGSGMIPGEGIEIERYDAIELGAGGLATLMADPTSWYVQAGLFGAVGPAATFVRGHFRTIMEVQADQSVRVELEKISEQTEKLQGQVDIGFKFSPFTLMNSLINMETSFGQARKTILDMSFDTTQPAAAHALKMAYLGKFTEAINLAASANTHYQGVRLLQTSKVKENSQGRDFQIFTFNKQSTLTHDLVSTQIGDQSSEQNSDKTGDNIVESSIEESKALRKTMRSMRDLEVTFQSSGENSGEKAGQNSVKLKYRLKSKQAKTDEIREFIDIAKLLAPAGQQAPAANFLIPQHTKNKLDGYFYLALDSQAFNQALTSVEGDGIPSEWMAAWAKLLNLPHADIFAGLTTDTQDAYASSVSGGKDHLDHFRNLVKALKKTLKSSDPDKQAKTFVKSYRGEGTDLYPLAALASICDKAHIVALEHMSVTTPGAANSSPRNSPAILQFETVGPEYTVPAQLLY